MIISKLEESQILDSLMEGKPIKCKYGNIEMMDFIFII